MSFLTPQSQACLKLSTELSKRPPLDSALKGQLEKVVVGLRAAAYNPSHETTGIRHALELLAGYFHTVSHHQHLSHAELSNLLANATREAPSWRPLFGLPKKPTSQENEVQVRGEVAPDCILEVARRIIDQPWHESRREQIQSALRIVANCCADNDANRSVIIHRGGVESMMKLAEEKQVCDLVIPTLYNVCVDFDEPAVDNEGKPWPSLRQKSTGNGADSGPALNAAEQKLGMAWNGSRGVTSVEILLGMKDSAENSLGTLADLVEMASRVALYGIQYLVRNLTEDETVQDQETGSLALVHSLLTQGSDLAQDPECRVSICQAVLNVLSQQSCYRALVDVDGAIWKLIHLPYALDQVDKEDEDEDEDGNDDSLVPYRKAILKIAYEISGLDTYGEKFKPESTLIRDCIHSLEQYNDRSHLQIADTHQLQAQPQPAGPWASICILLANSITSTDRAVHLIKSSSIASVVKTLITLSADSDVLLPAVDLGTRLALCRDGQDALHEAGMMSATRKLLKFTTSETDAVGVDIQRQTVALIRLLVKGRADYLCDLSSHQKSDSNLNSNLTLQAVPGITRDPSDGGSILAATVSLFKTTTDTRTKTEIGRLCVEVVRTLFSSIRSSTSTSTITTTIRPTDETTTRASPTVLAQQNDLVETKLVSLLGRSADTDPVDASSSSFSPSSQEITIADAIAYIITQPQPQPQTQQQMSNPSETGPNSASAVALQLQTEGEAWFGLALLSNLPIARPWIIAALGRNRGQVLERLRGSIAAYSSSSSSLSTERKSEADAVHNDHDHDHDRDSGERGEILGGSSHSATVPEFSPSEQSQGRENISRDRDPLYENVKVLVLKMVMQQQEPVVVSPSGNGLARSRSQEAVGTVGGSEEALAVLQGLKSSAIELGFSN